MGKVIIITYANFPNGEAASVRINCIAKLIQICGHEPIIISMSRVKPFIWNTYEGIKYISIRTKKTNTISKIINYILLGKLALKVIKSIDDIFAIMPLSLPLNAMLEIENFTKKRSLLLLTDRTEWYSTSEFNMGFFSIEYQQNNITNKYIIDKYWRVISISTYLENYYKSKRIRTVRVPAVMDICEFKNIEKYRQNSKYIIIYAGSPAKKDSLDMMVKAVSLLKKRQQDRIDFRVIGVTKDNFKKLYSDISISSCITFYGRLPRNEVKEHLEVADFTMLLRNNNERFSKAGFPSKVAESMSAGIPVITNYTTDLKKYLIDEKNSIIVKEYSVESFADAVARVLDFSDDKINYLRKEAIKTARKYFWYINYIQEIQELLKI